MPSLSSPQLGGLGCLAVAAAPLCWAQSPAAPALYDCSLHAVALRHVAVADGQSFEIRAEHAPLADTPAWIGLAAAGALWSYGDNGEGWVGRTVALGNGGTQVFAEFDTASDRVTLLSGFDTEPVVPVWAHPVPSASTNARVHASDATDRAVSCRQIAPAGSGPREVVVSAYRSSAPTPQWTWTFPTPTHGASRAMISADGTRIVAALLDPTTTLLHVAVWDGESGVPVRTFAHPCGVQLQALTLAEDGHVLYAATTSGGFLFDVDAGALIQQIVLLQSLAAQDVSGDGGILAIGYFGGLDVWERQDAGHYLRTWQKSWPGPIVCQQLDVSADGSTLAVGLGYYDLNQRVRVEAIDLRTKNTTMWEEVEGAGAYQNVVSRVACSADGRTFAVGLWGDEAGLVPELRVYRRGQDAPIATANYPGSVYDLSISASGDRVAVGLKSVHANVLAGGGSIDLHAVRAEDFRATGTPAVGRKVDFEFWGEPNSPARLLFAPAPAIDPAPFGNWGTLYLERTLLDSLPMTSTGATGRALGEFQIAPDPRLIGTTLWFQGLTTAPRRFSADYVRLTILP